MVHALHREVRLPVVVHDDAGDAIEQAAAPGRDPVEGQPGTRGDVQPLGPPADPQAGLVHVLDRRRFHQVADHLDDAFEAPGAASAHPRDGRRNQGDGEQIRHQLGQTIFGQELVVRQVDHHGPDPRAIPHRAGDASGKGGPGLPATSPATATMRPMLHDHQGPGLGQIENLAGAMAGGHLRRQSRTTVRAGLGIMIGNRVGFGDLAQGLALVALLPARLAARLLAQAPGAPPLLLPRRRLAQSIAGRRLAAVGAVQAEPALEFVEPCRQRQHQIDQFVFRQEGKGFTIHWILESHHPLLVNQNLGIQSIKPTKSARPSYPAARPSATWAVTRITPNSKTFSTTRSFPTID